MIRLLIISVIGLMLSVIGSCAEPTTGVDLPARVGPVDLSKVTAEFRASGGPAFVRLTGEPTTKALGALQRAGLAPPKDRPAIVTFPELKIATVWGLIPPNGVDKIANLSFVVMIEPSSDPDGIYPR